MPHPEVFPASENKRVVSGVVCGAAGTSKQNQCIVEQRTGFVTDSFQTVQEIAAVTGEPAIVIAPIFPFGGMTDTVVAAFDPAGQLRKMVSKSNPVFPPEHVSHHTSHVGLEAKDHDVEHRPDIRIGVSGRVHLEVDVIGGYVRMRCV